MGIKVRYEPVEAIGRAAYRVGRAARQAEIAEQQYKRAIDLQQRQQLMEYEQQLSLKAKQQAMDWEVQKMMLRSQNDFLLEEEKRRTWAVRDLSTQLRKADELDQAIDLVMKDDTLSPDNKQEAIQRIRLKKLGFGGVLPGMQAPKELEQKILTPGQQVSALKALQELEEGEATNWLQRLVPGGKEPLTPQQETMRTHLQGLLAKSQQKQAGMGAKALDEETARDILAEAGGDKERARQIAISRGYKF